MMSVISGHGASVSDELNFANGATPWAMPGRVAFAVYIKLSKIRWY